MKIVFMGSPDFAIPSLSALAESGNHIAAVVTQPDRPRGRGKKLVPTPVKQFSELLGLPVWQPQKLSEIKSRLQEIDPTVIVVVAFGKILSPEILALPSLGCINVHASLLPKYRGSAPIHRAIINGETVTGVTTMFMNSGLDTGDMLFRETVSIGENETTGDLHDRLAQSGARLLIKTLYGLEAGEVAREPQNGEDATYAPPLSRDDEIIHWNKSAREIKNLVRGLNPWPGARTYLNGKVLKIWRVEDIGNLQGTSTPGTVVDTDPDKGIVVETGKGKVLITELQLQGRKRMGAAQFLRGYSPVQSVVLGNDTGEDGME